MMTRFLRALAEMWRWRWKIGFPVLLGLLWGLGQACLKPELHTATAVLQLESEQATDPLLQKITARGHAHVLYRKLTDPDVLADSGRELGVVIRPQDVGLRVLNDHMMAITYRSGDRKNIEQILDTLAFNFIQQVLAPERTRIDVMLGNARQDLAELNRRIAELRAAGVGSPAGVQVPPQELSSAETPAAHVPPATLEQLTLRKQQVERDIAQLETSLQLVNTAFDRQGSQALLWFAQPAVMDAPTPVWARALSLMLFGGGLGLMAGMLVFYLPEWNRRRRARDVETPRDVQQASGLPVAGTLPWLGRVRIGHGGATVTAQGRTLRPSGFGEVSRLQSTLMRTLRGPLVLVGVGGLEGTSLVALLLAEKAASLGKSVVLVDLNLKNRELSQVLGLRGEAWTMPRSAKAPGGAKATWSALQSLTGVENLKVLPAPRNPETLAALAEQGGIARLMDILGELADVVIVDTSPVGATNRANVDAVSVAGTAARVAMVVQAGVTAPEDLRQATDTLLLAGAPLTGVILNQQFLPTRRQLLGEMADCLGPLGGWLRKAAMRARID